MAAQYHYFGGNPGLHRPNSASLGLRIHHPQYVLDAMSPETYYVQSSSLGMTTSPTQMSRPDLFDFQMPPPQQPTPNFTLPERRHTAYARIERPVVPHTMPFTPPSSIPQPASFEPSGIDGSWELDEDSASFVSDDDEEEKEIPLNDIDVSNGDNIGPLVVNNVHGPLDQYGTQVRSFHSLAEDDVLVHYMPSPTDTPLNNPKMATIFWYFVNITAPTINCYERHRPDPQRMFSNEPIPKSHQHIWTCRSTPTFSRQSTHG